jgi:F-type H+-transporting ATPase subunit b
MPQLEISNWPPQLIWLAISFGLLYFVVSRLVIPRTGGVIEQRKNTIESDLAAAVAKKAESEAALKNYDAAVAAARSESSTVSVKVRNALSAEADAAKSKLEAELSARAAQAEKSIHEAKSKALGKISDVAADIAADIVAQLGGGKVTKTAAAEAVSRAAK